MSEVEHLVLPINDSELVSSLGAFREEVARIFEAKDGAYCKEGEGLLGEVALTGAYREPGHALVAPYEFRAVELGAVVIDEDSKISSIPSRNLINVAAEMSNIHGPMRNDGIIRSRNFSLGFSSVDREGNVFLSASSKHKLEKRRRGSGEVYETESGSSNVITIKDRPDLAQRLGWAVHLVDVYVNPEKHPDSQLLA